MVVLPFIMFNFLIALQIAINKSNDFTIMAYKAQMTKVQIKCDVTMNKR
jgi:hypothetical protein